VVAAGAISGNTTPTGRSTVNDLRVQASTALAAGTQLRLSFGGYQQPPAIGGPQYVVKAMPWPSAPIANLSVSFAGFQADGFLLLVSKNGAALAAGELNTLQLMVEVSQYA